MLDSVPKESLLNACFIHNANLSHFIDPSITLCAVTRIDLSKNSLRTFPLVLLELPSLVKLNLTRNQITTIPEDSAVSSFSLEEIHLKENRLENLPKFIFQLPALKFLDASVNRIAEMPSEMWSSPSLVSLNLSNNCLSWLPASLHDPAAPHRSSSNFFKFHNASHGSLRLCQTASYTGSLSSVELDTDDADVSREYFMNVNMLTIQSK